MVLIRGADRYLEGHQPDDYYSVFNMVGVIREL
jgi:hypothetical protein